jgi:hypothetical protein
MFQRNVNDEEFTFIDMVKGIFPLSLYNLILFFIGTGKKEKARNIGINLLNFIFDETNKKIWLKRCENMKKLEKTLGISRSDKKKPDHLYNREKQIEIAKGRKQGNYSLYKGLESVREHIMFGKEILGFMVYVIRVGKCF